MTISLLCEECGYECEFDNEDQARDNNWWQDNNGDWYCEDCHGYCQCCDEHYPSSHLEYVEELDSDICERCLENRVRTCDHCNRRMWEDEEWVIQHEYPDSGTVEEELWCESCRQTEEANGRIRRDGEYIFYRANGGHNMDSNGHILQVNLNPEAWEEMALCSECQELGGGQKCSRCLKKQAKEMDKEETNLWVYDTKPQAYHTGIHNHFKETKYREEREHPYLYYGMEFECLFNSGADINTISKEYIKATKGLFVAEFDRSVTNMGNGIEFISRPLSYKKWMSEEVYLLLKEGRKVLEKYNAFNPQPDCCGIHVHMSLRFFEKNTKKKVQEIKSDIDWMFQIFQPEIEKISQRKFTRYCASKANRLKEVFRNGINSYGFNINPKITIEKGNLTQSLGSGDTHHDAIIQTNKTIEVRTFRSTIEVEEMLAIIEFCRSIAHAARNKKLNTKTTLGDILYCKDVKYLPDFIKKKKVNTEAKFNNKLEVKI